METVNFKERVKNECIKNVRTYEENFIGYEYLICSRAFEKGYYIIKSDKGNYLHLIGVHTELSAMEFYDKCYNNELTEDDFDFNKKGKSEKSVKGSVREKIKVLPEMLTIFQKELSAEENFKKNVNECAFATTDNTCTLGFALAGRPKSLMKGNTLDQRKQRPVDLIFRRVRSSNTMFNELLSGDIGKLPVYMENVKEYLSGEFINNYSSIRAICNYHFYRL